MKRKVKQKAKFAKLQQLVWAIKKVFKTQISPVLSNMVKTSGKANCRKHPIDMMVKNAIKTYFSSELLLFY